MGSKMRIIIGGLLVLALLGANVSLSYAHNWWHWHWHKSTLHVYVFGAQWRPTVAAIRDWDRHVRDLKLHTKFKGHTDISAFSGNYGATGWWGLASIEATSYDWWHFWDYSRIEHAHARFNSYYGGTTADVQGVQCQEIGHTFGLHHSNTGDCMGKGYYNSINVTGSHNWSDINAKF